MPEALLSLDNVHAHMDQHHILQGVCLEVAAGGATVLLGRNGAGKSSTLKTIMGVYPASKGKITFMDKDITRAKTYDIARMGIGFVPEDRAVLFNLTVEENFKLSMIHENDTTLKNLEEVLTLFPALQKFWKTKAGLLSGGQKQMLAIARVFVCDHALLLIDEPSKGLAPIVVDQLGEALVEIRDKTKVILVEQNFNLACQVGLDCFILDDGHVVHHGLIQDLAGDKQMMKTYLGI